MLVAELLLELLLLVLLQLVLQPDRLGAGALEGLLIVAVRVWPCPSLVYEFANTEACPGHPRISFTGTPWPLSHSIVRIPGMRWGKTRKVGRGQERAAK